MTARNKELAYLVAVSGLTVVGFASVYIARRAVISWGSMGYAGFFIALYLTAHLISRRTVPNADPYLLPMAGFLTAIGLTEIYRLNPDDAFRLVVEAHHGLDDEASAALDAALVLILANHIGDLGVLREAVALAKRGVADAR